MSTPTTSSSVAPPVVEETTPLLANPPLVNPMVPLDQAPLDHPHGLAPSTTLPSGLVADQDKSLTMKVGETYEAIKEAAQPYISAASDAAQPIISAASGAVSTTINTASGAVSTTINTTSNIISNSLNSNSASSSGLPPNPPHGVAPNENVHAGIVADQDKSLTTTIKEAAQPYIDAVSGAAQPIISATSGAVSTTINATSGAVSSTINTTSNLISNITPNSTGAPGVPPTPPHGIAPNEDIHTGIVADQDKSLTTTIKEAAQPYITAVSGAAQPIISATSGAVSSTINSTSNLISNVTSTSNSASGVPPTPPHGIAPNEDIHGGIVADQDKSLTMKVGEKLETAREVAAEYIAGANQVVRDTAESLSTAVSSNLNSANQMLQTTTEQVKEYVNQAGRAAGLPYQTNPTVDPTAHPHGVAPTNFHAGVISEQDKSLPMKVGEQYAAVKEVVGEKVESGKQVAGDVIQQATAAVSSVTPSVDLNQAGRAVGLPYQTTPGVTPTPPHGVAPTNFHGGVVSEQDKSLPTKVGEQVQAVKEVVGEKVEAGKQVAGEVIQQATAAVSSVTPSVDLNQAGRAVGLPYQTTPGVTPTPPHGVAPTNFHGGVISEQDKSIPTKVGEQVQAVKEVVGEKVTEGVQAVGGVVEATKDTITGSK